MDGYPVGLEVRNTEFHLYGHRAFVAWAGE
jgi:hypothetical protein